MTGPDLKRIRESLGLTQTAMAERLRISQPRYTMYENGNRKIPEHMAYLIELTSHRYDGPSD